MLYLTAYVPTKSLKDECEVIIDLYGLGANCEAYSAGVGAWAQDTAEGIVPLLLYLYARHDATIEIERGDCDVEKEKERL